MELYCHAILRKLAKNIQNHKVFAVLVDGTQDNTGTEQESICIRYVDDDLHIHEVFLGLYKASKLLSKV